MGVGASFSNLDQFRIVHLFEGGFQRGYAGISLVELEHGIFGGHEFSQEGLGQEDVLGESVDAEALDAHEGSATIGEGSHSKGGASVAQVTKFPWAVHHEGNGAIFEHGFGGGAVEVVREDTIVLPLEGHLAELNHAFAVNANILGIVIAIGVQTEDVTTLRGHPGIGIIGSTAQNHTVFHFTIGNQLFAEVINTLPGGGNFGDEVGIVEEAEVLGGVGHTVEGTLVGEGLEGFLNEFAGLGAEFNRGQQAGGHEGGHLVVGDDDDVRAFASGGSHGELVADAGDVFDDNVDIVLGFEFSAELSQNGSALFICPDAEGRHGGGFGGGFGRSRGGGFGRSFGHDWGLGGGFSRSGGLCGLGAGAKQQSSNQSDCYE